MTIASKRINNKRAKLLLPGISQYSNAGGGKRKKKLCRRKKSPVQRVTRIKIYFLLQNAYFDNFVSFSTQTTKKNIYRKIFEWFLQTIFKIVREIIWTSSSNVAITSQIGITYGILTGSVKKGKRCCSRTKIICGDWNCEISSWIYVWW